MENEILKSHGQALLDRFSSYGFIYGLGLGVLVGVLIAGPNFYTWNLSTLLLIIFSTAVVGGIIGFLAPSIGIGSAAGGFGFGNGGSHSDSGGDGGSGSCDAGGGGGDGC